MSAFLRLPFCSGNENPKKTLCVDIDQIRTVGELMDLVGATYPVKKNEFKLLRFGHLALEEQLLKKDDCFDFLPKVFGGKGGFGSMLRAIGAQIEKTTNREACRDLSGRRMRDVNNEKKLKDWISKKVDRERERERIRRERLARRLAEPKHNFDDPNYETQKSQASENLEDALQKGLKKVKPSSTVTSESQRKRSAPPPEEAGPSKVKASRKSLEWMGIEGASDLDSDLSESEDEKSDTVGCFGEEDEVDTVTGKTGHHLGNANGSEGNNESKILPGGAQSESAACSTSKTPRSSLLSMLPPPCSSDEQKSDSKTPFQSETIDPSSVCLEDYSCSEDLERLGLDVLKSALVLRGMKCGGTLQQRAARLFSVKGLNPDEIDPSLRAKTTKNKSGKKCN